jgi:hypothetical protein
MTVKAMTGAETRMAITRVRDVMVFSSAILADRPACRRRASRNTFPGIPARMRPAVPTTLPRSISCAALDLRCGQLSVQRKCLPAVIDDDEIAVSGERPCERDGSVMYSTDRRSLIHGELHAVSAGARSTPGPRRPNRRQHASRDRPLEIAAKRAESAAPSRLQQLLGLQSSSPQGSAAGEPARFAARRRARPSARAGDRSR